MKLKKILTRSYVFLSSSPSSLFKYDLKINYLKDILHTVLCQLDISIFQEPLLILAYAAWCLCAIVKWFSNGLLPGTVVKVN